MYTTEENIIYKDPLGNKELENEFAKRLDKLLETPHLSRKELNKGIEKIQNDLKKKYNRE